MRLSVIDRKEFFLMKYKKKKKNYIHADRDIC